MAGRKGGGGRKGSSSGAGKYAGVGGANRNVRRGTEKEIAARNAGRSAARKSFGTVIRTPGKQGRILTAHEKAVDALNSPRSGTLMEQLHENLARFASTASAAAAARTAAATNTNASFGGLPDKNEYKQSPLAAYFRMYSSRIAPSAAANMARGMAGKNVIEAIKAATPGLSKRAPWKQGIRAYYPDAKSLKGLDVKDNWMFRMEAYDDNSNVGNTFVVGGLYNPHPGGQMLFFGQEHTGWVMEGVYGNPNNGGKVPRRIRFMGRKGETYRPNVMRENTVPVREELRNKIIEIISKRNRIDAERAFIDAQAQTSKRLGFGPKNQMYMQWYYTNKELRTLKAFAEKNPTGGFSS